MKTPKTTFILIAGCALVLASISCQAGSQLIERKATQAPANTAPQVTEAAPSQPESPATTAAAPESPSQEATAIPESQNPPESFSPCAEETCIVRGTFLLQRPIGSSGRNSIDTTYRFGAYDENIRDSHHGVDFLNSSGTPVLAAADGVVVVAGNDSQQKYGQRENVYGNLVILEHHLTGIDQPVYTLYGQLSAVEVKVKDSVKAGDEIGLVGMSGSVKGSTLRFEVRYGENSYTATRNPELWLAPLDDENGAAMGAIAGRVLDAKGKDIVIHNIVVEQLGETGQPPIDQFYLRTYADQKLTNLPPWQESFAAGGLPSGSYQVSFWLNGMQQQVVQVKPGKLTYITFQINQ